MQYVRQRIEMKIEIYSACYVHAMSCFKCVNVFQSDMSFRNI